MNVNEKIEGIIEYVKDNKISHEMSCSESLHFYVRSKKFSIPIEFCITVSKEDGNSVNVSGTISYLFCNMEKWVDISLFCSRLYSTFPYGGFVLDSMSKTISYRLNFTLNENDIADGISYIADEVFDTIFPVLCAMYRGKIEQKNAFSFRMNKATSEIVREMIDIMNDTQKHVTVDSQVSTVPSEKHDLIIQ